MSAAGSESVAGVVVLVDARGVLGAEDRRAGGIDRECWIRTSPSLTIESFFQAKNKGVMDARCGVKERISRDGDAERKVSKQGQIGPEKRIRTIFPATAKFCRLAAKSSNDQSLRNKFKSRIASWTRSSPAFCLVFES